MASPSAAGSGMQHETHLIGECRATTGAVGRKLALFAATILVPQAIVAAISPWVGRRAETSGQRPLLLVGWGLIPLQALVYAMLADEFAVVFGSLLNAF